MILVVEDTNKHFEVLREYLVQMCLTLQREHEIVRAQSTDEARRVIEHCRRQTIPLIVIFDLLMEVPGGPHRVTRFVRNTWTRANDEWLAKVPIVVWSVHVDELSDLPPRSNSILVNKLGSTGIDDLEELDVALRAAIA